MDDLVGNDGARAVTAPDLPSIDLRLLPRGAGSDERERLRSAARDIGAFLVTGHGVEDATVDALLRVSRQFFGLPQAERDAIDMIHSPYFRGYSVAGSERTQGQPDLREQLDVGPEEAPRTLVAGDPPYLRLHGPNLWPASLPELRSATLDWMRRLRGVSMHVLGAIVDAFGLSHETVAAGCSGQPHERLKIIKYPGVGTGSALQGVGEHSDSGVLTLIVQDGVRGLHVYDGSEFIDVIAQRGAMIAVLGRALHAATAGAVVAARHRVATPPAGSDRISVAYFLNPRLDHARYGDEALKVVLRSHPETARRFFGDLVRV